MTQLLVLGLLNQEPRSGYDIQMLLQTSDAESWGGVLPGSIYHALKTLERDGCIEVAAIEQTGHRQKAIYRITEAGRRHFEHLLIDALQGCSVPFPTQLYSGLNFLDRLSGAQAAAALLKQQDGLKQALARLEQGKEEKTACMGGHLHPISELVFEHMRASISHQLHFVEQVIGLLNT